MAWDACHHRRSGREVERASPRPSGESLTPLSWTHGSARVVQAKNALRQKWRGKTLPDIATVCRPVRSSRRPAGYSANDASHAARTGLISRWAPGHSSNFCWHALCLCQCARLPAAACMHDAHTAAASASASITSVSAHTHWALGAEPMPPSSSRARTCMPDRRRQAPRPLACCCCAVPLPCCSQWRGPHGLAHRYPLQLCHRPRLVFSTCLRKSNR